MRESKTSEYQSWQQMKQRCLNPNVASFKNYGGRGISVCDRWMVSYEAFRCDMGPRPSAKHSIDRINNDGHYEPSNCRWATASEQASNQRRSPRYNPPPDFAVLFKDFWRDCDDYSA
jgi:hypothetical protein